MRVLLTNDDGIYAAGIQSLWKELSRLAEVIVVAPDQERSAISHAITVHQPIRINKYHVADGNITAWMVSGTPSDCVKMAVQSLLDQPPDLIVSGINFGANLGTDVLYSGTVSAAIEGAILGIPSIAVSLATYTNPYYDYASQFTCRVIETMQHRSWDANMLLNINVPSVAKQELRGVRITKLGIRQYENTFERRQDPRGRVYYWMAGEVAKTENDPDSDVVACADGYVSVTPIHYDLTNYPWIEQLKKWEMDL